MGFESTVYRISIEKKNTQQPQNRLQCPIKMTSARLFTNLSENFVLCRYSV